MMHSDTTIIIGGPLPRIVELAADVERWPEILPHYRWVTLLGGGGDRKVVEMAARRGRIPLRWRAVQKIDRSGMTPVIDVRPASVDAVLGRVSRADIHRATQSANGSCPPRAVISDTSVLETLPPRERLGHGLRVEDGVIVVDPNTAATPAAGMSVIEGVATTGRRCSGRATSSCRSS